MSSSLKQSATIQISDESSYVCTNIAASSRTWTLKTSPPPRTPGTSGWSGVLLSSSLDGYFYGTDSSRYVEQWVSYGAGGFKAATLTDFWRSATVWSTTDISPTAASSVGTSSAGYIVRVPHFHSHFEDPHILIQSQYAFFRGTSGTISAFFQNYFVDTGVGSSSIARSITTSSGYSCVELVSCASGNIGSSGICTPVGEFSIGTTELRCKQ